MTTSRPHSFRRALVGAAALLVAPLMLAPVAAHAATEPGGITVTKTVEGGEDPSGFVFELSSENCEVPEGAATATSDADGRADFAGLPVFADEDETTQCLYAVTEQARDGFTQVTDAADLTGPTAGEVSAVTNSGVALTSASGVLSNATRNPEPNGSTLPISCLEGEGTAEMRAGRSAFTGNCLPTARKSGLGVTGRPTPQGGELPLGSSVIAEVTHFNQTIQRGLHNGDATLALEFTDLATGQSKTVDATYTVRIDETSDTARPCEYDVPQNGGLLLRRPGADLPGWQPNDHGRRRHHRPDAELRRPD